MTDYVASIAVDNTYDALARVVALFMRGGSVVRGQVNRVPLPAGLCAVLTNVHTDNLSRPAVDYLAVVPPALMSVGVIGARLSIQWQIDFYGNVAEDISAAFIAAFRSAWCPTQFPEGIAPLYCTDATNAPLVTGEQQYENRFMVTATMQYNPAVTVPQEFADTLQTESFTAADLLPESVP